MAGTYSVLVPFTPRRPEQLLPYAALVAWTGARRLWQGQTLLVEPHQGFAYAAGAGFRVPAGLGVTLTGLRHPFEAALQARSLAMVTGHSVLAGFGPGARSFQEALGGRYRSPLTAVREYVSAVRELLGGGAVDHTGEYIRLHAQLPATPMPSVDIGLGVLRPGMARLAGEVADAAITWLTPAPYLAQTVVPALRAGADAAGRPLPRLVAMVPMALQSPDRDPVRLAFASNAAHLRLPHYRDMLRRAGAHLPDADETTAAKALVACGAFLSGTPQRLAEQLHEFFAAGVDEVVLNVTGVHTLFGHQAAIAELKSILGEIAC
jgi:alkanesulfonate monooxygenase SsuD/methylene tetrahydromethanopterin reductase-like flavin-dependent oxidoreductase (luciferase family)